MTSVDVMQYGQCPNCEATGKGFAYHYLKLDERNFWVRYRVCKTCGVPFGHRIEGVVGTDFWRCEEAEKMKGLTGLYRDMAEELKQSLSSGVFWRGRSR